MGEPERNPTETRASSSLRTAGWGLAIAAGTRIIAAVLSSASLAALVAEAVLVEYGTTQLGVAWSEERRDPKAAQRAGAGAVIGVALAVCALLLFLATRSAVVRRAQAPELSAIGIGLVSAILIALRDELLFHGLVLRIVRDVGSPLLRALACGLTSAGASLGEPSASGGEAAARFVFGTLLGALWLRDRGAWLPVSAHAVFLFVTGPLFHGGLVEVDLAVGAWTGARANLLGGFGAALALVPFAAFAVYLVSRPRSPSPVEQG